MRILLLGANGQLGHTLSRALPLLGETKTCTRADVDLTDAHAIIETIDTFQPDVIVNAAAYTAVDKAESERNTAFAANAEALTILAHEAAKRNIWLIHYSTDYVFDGRKTTPYTENDLPNPINAYGESKLAGEQAIAASNCDHLIFRTTWVIGKDGNNFVKTILCLAATRDSLRVIDDQFGVPTTTTLITKVTMDAITAIAEKKHWPSGIYHLAPHGKTTWHGIAKTLLQLAAEEQADLTTDVKKLRKITTAEYPTAAKRPANSLLDTSKLQQHLTFNLPDWEYDFSSVAQEIIKEFKAA